MALLGELGVVEQLVGGFEIGAGVLPVGIQEQRIEPAVEIVMMRDVAPRARRHIELLQPPVEKAQPPLQSRPVRRHAVGGLTEHDREQVGDGALLDPQGAVHVGFAEPDLGIEQHAALRRLGHEADCDRGPAAVAKNSESGATRRGEPEDSPANKSLEQQSQQPVHRPHLSCLSAPAPNSPEPGRSAQPAKTAVRIGVLDQNKRFRAMRWLATASLSRNYRLKTGFALIVVDCGGHGGYCCRK